MIKYKNFFIGLLIVAFIFQISKFYTFYEDYSDWQYADWLINYQGGFVRRGLIGEILFKIHIFLSINLKSTALIGNFLLKHPITEVSLNSIGTNTDVDDGPRYFYGSQTAYEQSSKEMAESLGYSVINYIMDGGMSDIGNTNFPDGPPLGVSYFPVGDAGSSMAGTDYTGDIKGKPAYKKWRTYIGNFMEYLRIFIIT
mgnify:CR=1 FL=1